MPRPLITLASALCLLAACEGAKPAASKTAGDEPVERTSGSVARDRGAEPSKPSASKPDDQPPSVELVSEPAPAERPPPPAWFDATKIEHQSLVKQMASEGTMAGGYASALILELEPGISNEQCIERAKAVLGQSIPELPEPTPDGERLMLQGKTDDYHYTVVCGEAKGKPTMYLSYTSK